MATRSCWLPPAALDHKLEEGLAEEEPKLGVASCRGEGELGWGGAAEGGSFNWFLQFSLF